MELIDFLRQTQAEVRVQAADKTGSDPYPYAESEFADVVMRHLFDAGMTFADPTVCHLQTQDGNTTLRLSGYAISEDAEQLDLFVSLYHGSDEIIDVRDDETRRAAEQCIRFLKRCVEGKLTSKIDQSNDAYVFAETIRESYQSLSQIRIYVLTDGRAKSKRFQERDIAGKTVKLEVMDIERLHRHLSEGKPRDELVLNFQEVCGSPLPCVYLPGGKEDDCNYVLTAIPGVALRLAYERFGDRLLEANVRSYLGSKPKNVGIRETLRKSPSRFMAFNNGIVVVADSIVFDQAADGGIGILWLKGMQIVNGGQTTASIYFAKKDFPDVDLSAVRVAAKIIILGHDVPEDAEESLIADISKYSNTQSAVKASDLSANKPFHVAIERLAYTTYCPDGVGRWFYERAAGSYDVMLRREGKTLRALNKIKAAVPKSRRITKTDLAKFQLAWAQKPNLVALGSEKTFAAFVKTISDSSGGEPVTPDIVYYKHMVAKAILFQHSVALVRPYYSGVAAYVGCYLVSVMSKLVSDRVDLERIWLNQGLSTPLQQQLTTWGHEVHAALRETSPVELLSEWAKKEDCWQQLGARRFSAPKAGIPEIRGN